MDIFLWAGFAIALYGAWLVHKGAKTGFKPRVLNGWAVILVGVSLMVNEVTWLRWTLLIAAIALFFQSMRTLRQHIRRRRQG